MNPSGDHARETQALLASLKTFCVPAGDAMARRIRGVKLTQRGEFRMSPGGKWTPFTADEWIDATRSAFCWDARFGGGRLGSYMVTDAYGGGRGRLTIKLGGFLPVKRLVGPEFDRGELQRYLGEIIMCPTILLNHSSLEFVAVAECTLRVRDSKGPAGATVDILLDESGCPSAVRADRPRAVGIQTVLTPWSGICLEFQKREGFRGVRRFEVRWDLPKGLFTYMRGEVTSNAGMP